MATKAKTAPAVTVESMPEERAFCAVERHTVTMAGKPFEFKVAVFRKGGGPVVQPWGFQRSAGVTSRAAMAFYRSDAGRAAWLAAERMAAECRARWPNGAPPFAGASTATSRGDEGIDL